MLKSTFALIASAVTLSAAVSTTAVAGDRGVNTAVGAVIGAAVGHSAGGRDGAIVGGVIGAAVGNSIGRDSRARVSAHYNDGYDGGRGYYDDGYRERRHVRPRPVYVESRTYYEPAPVYVERRVRRPVVVVEDHYYRGGRGHGYRHGHGHRHHGHGHGYYGGR